MIVYTNMIGFVVLDMIFRYNYDNRMLSRYNFMTSYVASCS